MRDALNRLMKALREPVGEPTPEQREHDLRLATSALLFEVVRADGFEYDAIGRGADQTLGAAQPAARETARA